MVSGLARMALLPAPFPTKKRELAVWLACFSNQRGSRLKPEPVADPPPPPSSSRSRSVPRPRERENCWCASSLKSLDLEIGPPTCRPGPGFCCSGGSSDSEWRSWLTTESVDPIPMGSFNAFDPAS